MQATSVKKPDFGQPCNGCGYCCSTEPCALAKEFLHCLSGPCVAMETGTGRSICGLVRNPLGYLYSAVNPAQRVSVLEAAPNVFAGHELSTQFASALGFGLGCDADNSADSASWLSSKLKIAGS